MTENTAVPAPSRPDIGALTTIALGTSVVLWAIAYIGLAPTVRAPEWALLPIVAMGLLAAGFFVGRSTTLGMRGGIGVGLLLGAINFIIVASLNGKESTAEALTVGLLWIGGATVVSIVLAMIGTAIGTTFRSASASSADWTPRLALLVALTTLPLLISGGIVTGLEEGMAVPDWLTTYRYPMMFYPMSMMQEDAGVYVEHFHRLWGLLVGLSVIMLLVQMRRTRQRPWLQHLSIGILVAVIIQGILGGTRVTEDNIALAIMHGIFGQVVFSTIVLMAAFTTLRWKQADRQAASTSSDFQLSLALVILLVGQLALGAVYRHLNLHPEFAAGFKHSVLGLHILVACIVAFVAITVGVRAKTVHAKAIALPTLGVALMVIVSLQLLLGIGAAALVMMRGEAVAIPAMEVAITTLHQATGACLLGTAVLAAAWVRRLYIAPSATRAAAPA
ncbi:MAG: hypothetical protein AAF432_06845 [Planctomycetota bacterium]